VRNNGLSDPPVPEYYLVRKHVQDDVFENGSSWRSIKAIVRSPLAPQVIAREIRSGISQLDPTLPVDIEPMRERLETLTARPRFTATLLAMFSAAALLLAAIGIHGVIAFLVSQ
jgi:putative ABC transport system permease protein